jgi:hypothetical protein
VSSGGWNAGVQAMAQQLINLRNASASTTKYHNADDLKTRAN